MPWAVRHASIPTSRASNARSSRTSPQGSASALTRTRPELETTKGTFRPELQPSASLIVTSPWPFMNDILRMKVMNMSEPSSIPPGCRCMLIPSCSPRSMRSMSTLPTSYTDRQHFILCLIFPGYGTRLRDRYLAFLSPPFRLFTIYKQSNTRTQTASIVL